nr:hypothetical protein [Tanacetum cinerariifolium]
YLPFSTLLVHQRFNKAKKRGFKDDHGASSSTFKIIMLLLILLAAFTLNPHTALMTIYYWKLDNKQVTIQFRGGLLGIVIPAARVFCFCWQVFIFAGDLFLLEVLHYCC